MHSIHRRAVVGGLALLTACRSARAATPEQLSVDADDGRVNLTRYASERSGKRPTVLILHGSHGFDLKPRAYERYAHALAAKGVDGCFLRYFTEADAPAFDSRKTSRERREAYEAGRFDGWAKRVSAVVSTITARLDSSGRIGLLGFSLGGFVATDAAARDERVAALAVLYGGMPDAMAPAVKRLPPLIALHGEADRNVPFAKSEELVKLARATGAEAELVGYPGKPHGFDFSDSDPMAMDAVSRVVRFFEAQLKIG
jgi:carboxymethylenebutenolidase